MILFLAHKGDTCAGAHIVVGLQEPGLLGYTSDGEVAKLSLAPVVPPETLGDQTPPGDIRNFEAPRIDWEAEASLST